VLNPNNPSVWGLEVLKKSSLTWSHGAELKQFMVIGRFLFFAACRKKSEQ
jgi:hypothetical protein